MRQLGKRIRELRIRGGFASQEAFADYCKMHRTFLGHLETGRKNFRLTTIIRVADALGVTLAELFAGLERGEALNSKRTHSRPPDLDRVRQELTVLESTIRNLRALLERRPKEHATRASPPSRKRARQKAS